MFADCSGPQGQGPTPTGAVLSPVCMVTSLTTALAYCCSTSAFVTPVQHLFQEVIPDTIFEHLWPLR